jgi:hypothetical protein
VTNPHKSTKKDNITIGELVLGSVEPHGTSSWTQVLKVPPLPPSNLNNCSIIDLEYDLKVSCCKSTFRCMNACNYVDK